MSIVIGTQACNARCPFCVSGMTTKEENIIKKVETINSRNFKIALELANIGDVTTLLFTGKGEPTLYPTHLTDCLSEVLTQEHKNKWFFPLKELQTNAITIHNNYNVIDKNDHLTMKERLELWYDYGLTTICISMVHYDQEKNRQIYLPHKEKYIDLEKTIDYIHNAGLNVRLTCVGLNNHIDTVEEVENLLAFSKKNGVEQTSLTPVTSPTSSESKEIFNWTSKNYMKPEKIVSIQKWLTQNHTLIKKLAHDAKVYDINGQNFGFKNCLTIDPEDEKYDYRQIIFFPNTGKIMHDWQYQGAQLL